MLNEQLYSKNAILSNYKIPIEENKYPLLLLIRIPFYLFPKRIYRKPRNSEEQKLLSLENNEEITFVIIQRTCRCSQQVACTGSKYDQSE